MNMVLVNDNELMEVDGGQGHRNRPDSATIQANRDRTFNAIGNTVMQVGDALAVVGGVVTVIKAAPVVGALSAAWGVSRFVNR